MVSDGGIETTQEQGRTIPGIVWVLTAAVLVTGAGYYFLSGPNEAGPMSTTFVVRQGDLDIVVLEGGIVEARESQQIRSEVKGSSKILNIVEEGYQVTAEDVSSGMILVELDTAQLRDKLISDQIAYESAEEQQIGFAADYEITINQNESTMKAAELLVKFARMDFQKFLGAKPVAKILKDLGLDEESLRIKAEKEAAEKARVASSRNLVDSSLGNIVNRPEGLNGGESASGAAGASPKFEDLIIDDELNQAIRAAFMERMSEGGAGGQWSGGGRGGGGDGGDGRPVAGRPGGRGGPGGGAGAEGRRGGGGGGRQLTPERIERMRKMGVDVYDIARKAGKLKTPEVPAEVPDMVMDGSVVDVSLVHQRPRGDVDFSKYTDVDALEDGQALQMLRTLKAALLSARASNLVALLELEGTKQLYAKSFVTKMDLDKVDIQVQNSNTSVEAAETAQELYIKYEFPKMAEQLLSNYEESLMALERAQKLADSRLSQSAAKMSSSKRKFLYEKTDLEKTRKMIANSIIPAKRTGLVVYGSSSGSGGRDSHRGGGTREPIMEGTAVRERQLILTIPDMTKMGVAVKVQESSIQKVKVGLKARITIESRPDEVLEGEVVKVAVLPDASDRWMNPDKTVYNVSVRIDSINEWLRPGATTQVEILVEKLVNVVYVPFQAISPSGNNRYVYVQNGSSVERRLVETGGLTDTFIEIKSGLSKGDVVQLRMPDLLDQSSPAVDGENGSSGDDQFASV